MPSPVGPLTLVGEGDDLDRPVLRGRRERARRARTGCGTIAACARRSTQLQEYFAGKRTRFDLPLAPRGTAFQKAVWAALLRIPFGETASYGDIARAIGKPAASRAVGGANHRNPIAIVIPCHRVIGADGSLTGYGGGLDHKRLLLELESRVRSARQRAALGTALSAAGR